MAVQEPVRTKGFLCKHCGIVCSNMPSLLEHMDTHLESEEDRKFKCDECGRGYRHAGSLANHKKTHEVGSFQCPICARQLSNSLALKNHLRIHTSRKKYSCMDCGKAFRLATQLATHQRVHRNREARGSRSRRGSTEHGQASSHEDHDEMHYKDEQSFDVVPDLEPDMGLNLPVEDSFSDSGMPDILPGSASSDKGASEDASDRPYKCNMCDKTYRHYGSLNNHKKTHTVGTFECTICFKQFNNLAALSSHQRIHSKTRGRSSAGATPPTAASTPTSAGVATTHPERKQEQAAGSQQNGNAAADVHFCHLCQTAFPNDDEFQDHILLHNSSSVSFELPVNMPDDGDFTYSASQSPEYPPSSDTPPMPPLLDKQEDYGQPVGSAENGQIYIPDPFQDEPPMLNSQGTHGLDGTAVAPASEDLQEDLSANHQVKEEEESSPDGDRRFKCNVCNKSYRHAGSLINHKRSHQTGVYQCSICRKNYPHLAALRSHHRIHRAQTSTLSHSAEGDWLSSEPQTLENQQGGYPLSEEDEEDIGDVLDLPEDLQDEPHLLPEHQATDGQPHHHHHHQGHQDEPMGYQEQYDLPYPQEEEAAHLPHGGEPLMERHMCADCGKTFGDIAGIKSHACPLHHHRQQQQQQQQHGALTNGSGSHVDYQGQHLIGESGAPVGYEGHGSAQGYYPEQHGYHQNMHGGMMGDERGHGFDGDMEEHGGEDEDDEYDGGEEEEEDGEMYHCSVCGNHYTSMRALRSHLRGHTQLHGTPSSSGPSSMSSLEAEKEEDGGGGENQPGDGSLIICSTCGESFTRKQDLMAHQLLHTQATASSSSAEPPPPQLLPPPPPLQPPPQRYGAGQDNPPAPKQEPASIICGKCGVSCVSFQHLESHPCPGQRREGVGDGVKSEGKPDGEPSLGRSAVGHLDESQGGDRLFKCEQCGRAYRHAGSLLNHKKSHKTGVFRCYVCQKRFYNLLALKSHERTHFDIKKHTCTECGKAFKIHKQLQNHLRVHEENKAKIQELNKQIQTLMQMNGELAQNGLRLRKAQRRKRRQAPSTDGGGAGAGPSPEKDSQGAAAVQSPPPGIQDPNDPRPYVCNQCGRSYRHAGSLVNHKNSHKTGEYHCSICNNTYSNQLAMKNHLRIHFGLKKHGCQACGKAFRGKKQLLNHRCAANRKNADGPARGRGRRRPREPTCKSCRQTFPSVEELRAHACAAPPTAAVVDAAGRSGGGGAVPREERPYKCGVCGRSYRHAGSLLNHKNTHKTGHFSCAFCGKPFSNPMALRNHTRIHTQKKKHVCPTCGKAFRLSSILHNHLKIHARGVSTFSCPTCGKTFQGRSGLKRHRCVSGGGSSGSSGGASGGRDPRRAASGQEGGDKCYTCDQCGRSYRHAGSLLNHKKTHSSDLLHCSLCLRTFADQLALESHAQMPRHCCPDCGKTFCEFAHMQSHMEVHSKGRPLPGGGAVAASGSGYHLHHPHSHHQQQLHPHHPHHQQQQQQQHHHPGQAQHAYPAPENMPIEDELDWNSGMDPRMGLQGGLPKMDQVFGQVHGGGGGGGGGMSSGGSSVGGYPGELQEHGEAGAESEKSHVCEHCGRAYRHAGSLLNHKNSHKMGSFFCSVCQKEFTNLMALKNHRRIHTEPKRYQCLECGKAFRVSTQLICHRRIHTKEKPFSCLLCDKRFSSKSNLRHHQKMHQNSQASYEASFDMDPNSFMGLGVDPFL
ncbi:zinc finger protein 646 [Alosa sapidissima]|uniref:zinc finger protein 646 n=1 Tax=Alosa sapidissima TaxID=34773 RepID=UPI001C0870FA|nr:zinc finger protein 646 [Alosa sapidissima]